LEAGDEGDGVEADVAGADDVALSRDGGVPDGVVGVVAVSAGVDAGGGLVERCR
jgi:hypothetical protein